MLPEEDWATKATGNMQKNFDEDRGQTNRHADRQTHSSQYSAPLSGLSNKSVKVSHVTVVVARRSEPLDSLASYMPGYIHCCKLLLTDQSSLRRLTKNLIFIFSTESNFKVLVIIFLVAFSALTLLVGRQEGHLACKKTEWCDAGMVICLKPSWCHCHSLSLASVKSRFVLLFWYWLTWVVPEKRPLSYVSLSHYLFEKANFWPKCQCHYWCENCGNLNFLANINTHSCACLTAFFPDYPGEQVPER